TKGVCMKKIIVMLFAVWPVAIGFAQGNAPTGLSFPGSSSSPGATSADVEALRQQVQALTETVKALQQQVKDQQTALDRVNGAATPTTNESVSADASLSPSPTAAPQFPTEDTSVVASTSTPETQNPQVTGQTASTSPGNFPTTDTLVAPTATSESGLTAP